LIYIRLLWVRSLWHIKSSLSKEIGLLFGQLVISAQLAKKTTFLPNLNEYAMHRQYVDE
jgi:hypothetical protein